MCIRDRYVSVDNETKTLASKLVDVEIEELIFPTSLISTLVVAIDATERSLISVPVMYGMVISWQFLKY